MFAYIAAKVWALSLFINLNVKTQKHDSGLAIRTWKCKVWPLSAETDLN
jgi:hypothetical protein